MIMSLWKTCQKTCEKDGYTFVQTMDSPGRSIFIAPAGVGHCYMLIYWKRPNPIGDTK